MGGVYEPPFTWKSDSKSTAFLMHKNVHSSLISCHIKSKHLCLVFNSPQIHGDTMLIQPCIPLEWNSEHSGVSLEENDPNVKLNTWELLGGPGLPPWSRYYSVPGLLMRPHVSWERSGLWTEFCLFRVAADLPVSLTRVKTSSRIVLSYSLGSPGRHDCTPGEKQAKLQLYGCDWEGGFRRALQLPGGSRPAQEKYI